MQQPTDHKVYKKITLEDVTEKIATARNQAAMAPMPFMGVLNVTPEHIGEMDDKIKEVDSNASSYAPWCHPDYFDLERNRIITMCENMLEDIGGVWIPMTPDGANNEVLEASKKEAEPLLKLRDHMDEALIHYHGIVVQNGQIISKAPCIEFFSEMVDYRKDGIVAKVYILDWYGRWKIVTNEFTVISAHSYQPAEYDEITGTVNLYLKGSVATPIPLEL